MLRAGLEPARITPHAPQTCAATNYATSANLKFSIKPQENYFFVFASFLVSAFFSVFAFAVFAGVFDAVLAGAFVETFATGGTAAGVFASVVFAAEFASTFAFVFAAGASVVVSGLLDRTEILPFNAGIASIKADNIKTVAATIVVFDKTVAVPREPKALLETLLVNKAPASVFPGCNKTEIINTIHERKNNPYKK